MVYRPPLDSLSCGLSSRNLANSVLFLQRFGSPGDHLRLLQRPAEFIFGGLLDSHFEPRSAVYSDAFSTATGGLFGGFFEACSTANFAATARPVGQPIRRQFGGLHGYVSLF